MRGLENGENDGGVWSEVKLLELEEFLGGLKGYLVFI